MEHPSLLFEKNIIQASSFNSFQFQQIRGIYTWHLKENWNHQITQEKATQNSTLISYISYWPLKGFSKIPVDSMLYISFS